MSHNYKGFLVTSWDGAKAACEQMNSHLIVINSKEEQEYIAQISLKMSAWIGLTDTDGEWKWEDKTLYNPTQTYWIEGQPDNWAGHGKGGGEDCVTSSTEGKWNDDQCSEKYYFICEKKRETK
ncbi:asialoglycoprotein receptor 2-like [Xenopus tropicalis]|uniref:Asialoglycoprotein receptor 2-like n=2 Tax=Xenopus tropicalis TaxID=8364 RepID=A0A8J1JB53_XENTR|nr:asialoglycoprotein receptor 2-like [Xenopus tropicalis]